MTRIREVALDQCAALPEARLGHPFGEDTAVFTVGGKVFALLALDTEHGSITVKAEPDDAAALVAQHPQVTPGYHMSKRHWVSVDLAEDDSGSPLPVGLVEELVEDSYRLVVAGLPAPNRPVPSADERGRGHA